MEKPCILVSACLLGMNCRYNGKGELNSQVLALSRDAILIPFCPEIYGRRCYCPGHYRAVQKRG